MAGALVEVDVCPSDDDEILIKTYGAAAAPSSSAPPTLHPHVPLMSPSQIQAPANHPDMTGSYSPSDADSELLMADVDEVTANRSFQKFRNWWEHPKLRENYKLVISSLLLTVLGGVLILTGVIVMAIPNSTGVHGWVFLVAGLLCFIPGSK